MENRMSQRFYLSKIKQYTEPGLTYWAHAFQVDHPGIEYKGGEIANDPVTGDPLYPHILIRVAAIDHTPFQGSDDLIPFPDVSPDVKVSSIHGPTKLAVKAKIMKHGVSKAEIDAVWDNADGMRDVLNYYGRLNNPDFDVNDFDLSDL